jgi:pimeloyl-ACP methyl ester carboxylesterase
MQVADSRGFSPAYDLDSTQTVRTDDGVSIAYRVVGTGPLTVLFIHGWGGAGTGHAWGDVLRTLDLAGIRAVLVDQRGHGRSEQTGKGFMIERFAHDLFNVADAVGAEQTVLVGYSMSAKWAQFMACSAPERVRGLVLVAPVPAMEIPLPEAEKERWLAVARSVDRAVFEDWLRAWTKEPLAADVVDRYFDDVSHTSQVTLGATLDMAVHGAFMERLPTITAPTLVIGGVADPLLPSAMLREAVVSQIPAARLALLECGHEIPVEAPATLAALLEAFLAGLRPRT